MTQKELTNAQLLSYELGVLLFELASGHVRAIKVSNGFDYKATMRNMIENMQGICLDDVADGFADEAKFMGAVATRQDFEDCLKRVKDEDGEAETVNQAEPLTFVPSKYANVVYADWVSLEIGIGTSIKEYFEQNRDDILFNATVCIATYKDFYVVIDCDDNYNAHYKIETKDDCEYVDSVYVQTQNVSDYEASFVKAMDIIDTITITEKIAC